jgi:hypothetical protein
MLQRLLIALSPMDSESKGLEKEVQHMAEELVGLSDDADAAGCARLGLLMAQKRVIADAMGATRETWGKLVEGSGWGVEEGRGCVEKGIFRQYCQTLGRKIGN